MLATMLRRLLSSWSLAGHRQMTIRFVVDVRLASQPRDRDRIRFRLSLVYRRMLLRLVESSRRVWFRRQWLGPNQRLVRSLLLLSLSQLVFRHLLSVFLKRFLHLELDKWGLMSLNGEKIGFQGFVWQNMVQINDYIVV